jgi:hypothetical protein
MVPTPRPITRAPIEQVHSGSEQCGTRERARYRDRSGPLGDASCVAIVS